MNNSNTETPIPFDEFIGDLRQTLKNVFYDLHDAEKFIRHRGFPATVLRDIMAHNPFSVAIPKKYGGRGCKAKECLGILDTASYDSLSLSLMFGINIGLFLEPVVKYGSETIKGDVFEPFLNNQHIG
ncbi:MAG: acyl-CoA dehydrogenase family protein [Bacteroidales bacterium]|nr:acyl-CoA dehydrogenase family protein [Bacteroidales bacterium]